jgi:hypothetical protein
MLTVFKIFSSISIFSVFHRSISHDSRSPESSGRRKSKSKKRSASENVLAYLLNHIVQEETPSHVARALLATLDKVDTEVCTLHFVQFLPEKILHLEPYCVETFS